MHKIIIVALIAVNCLLIAGAVYVFPIVMHTAAAVLEQAALTQQAHERIDVLERALRINTTPGPSRGAARMMNVTAYTAADWPDNPAYGITKSGHRLTEADAWRVAAADPVHYPAGTRIYIAGVGLVTVLDTGSEMKGPDRLDVFVGMEDRERAWQYGRQRVPAVVMR